MWKLILRLSALRFKIRSKALSVDMIWDFKYFQPTFQERLNLIAEGMQKILDHIFAYFDLPLSIGSDVIIKRHQMWLSNPQCGHKEGPKLQFFGEIKIKASPPNSDPELCVYIPSFHWVRTHIAVCTNSICIVYRKILWFLDTQPTLCRYPAYSVNRPRLRYVQSQTAELQKASSTSFAELNF